jgi:cellulose synthase/poly-beta-1,6-N-acetylglucosamine synthase-like glycosyltransferase
LTEDLDLSYRAQIRGWKFVYLQDLVVPAELPAEIHGFKSQKHRWAKGSVQTALKLTPTILTAPITVRCKVEALAHLTANLCYPLLLALTLLLWPSLWLRTHVLETESAAYFDVVTFGLASLSIAAFYIAAERASDRRQWHRRIIDLPVVFALGIGLAVNNTVAVFEALLGHESPFVRTPKHALTGTSGTWRGKAYFSKKSLTSAVEIFLGLYMIGTIAYSFGEGIYMGSPFLALFAFGYLYMGVVSFGHALSWPWPRREAAPLPAPARAAIA